uniref:Uncharacterized protein n=1 Tax=Sphenodon punctatus TaxID=8508 RepID=A0A8D0HVE2_SPHPU
MGILLCVLNCYCLLFLLDVFFVKHCISAHVSLFNHSAHQCCESNLHNVFSS